MKTAIPAELNVSALIRLKGQASPRNTPSGSVQASPTKSNQIQPPGGPFGAANPPRHTMHPTKSDRIRPNPSNFSDLTSHAWRKSGKESCQKSAKTPWNL